MNACACINNTHLCESVTRIVKMEDIPHLPTGSSSSSATPLRPRKRKRRLETWKRNVAKVKRAKGEECISPTTGKVIEGAKQGPPCTCQRKCFERFSEAELSRIFTCFWELGDKNVQDAYLHGLIRVKKVERRRPRRSHCKDRKCNICLCGKLVSSSSCLCLSPFLIGTACFLSG